MNRSFAVGFAAAFVAWGCGGDDSSTVAPGTGGEGARADTSAGPGSTGNGTTGQGGAGASASVGAGGGNVGEWVPLITADWELASGSEKTSDIHTKTLGHDIYIGAIRPIAPVGTHHTVLAVGGLQAGNIIYASGVGTNELVFPKGVGLKVSAGESLVLQLHLFNVSPDKLTGTSGVEVVEVAPGDLEQEADLFLPGPFGFSIPPNQTYTNTGKCTVSAPQHLFAIFPHMHQLGSHFKSTVSIGGHEQIIHDGDYSFAHQAFIPFEPIALEPGDSIETECTWTNTTPNTVQWGESSTTEMCFSILYRYPAQEGNGFCD